MDHYWFNGRDANAADVAELIVSSGFVKEGERLWWDVEAEGTKPYWSPQEVVVYAHALRNLGLPFNRQGIYLSSSVTRAVNWKPVVDLGLPLWVADCGLNNGQVSSMPLVGYWKEVELFQYTSAGKLPGYEGNLDLSISGADVWTVYELQEGLNKVLGTSLTVDGDFGPATKDAVVAFQKKTGLYPDGIPGKLTLPALTKALS